jgi:hypothetical protein
LLLRVVTAAGAVVVACGGKTFEDVTGNFAMGATDAATADGEPGYAFPDIDACLGLCFSGSPPTGTVAIPHVGNPGFPYGDGEGAAGLIDSGPTGRLDAGPADASDAESFCCSVAALPADAEPCDAKGCDGPAAEAGSGIILGLVASYDSAGGS